MILNIILFVLFILLILFGIYFVFTFLSPLSKKQTLLNNNPLFSDLELNYIKSQKMSDVKVSNQKAFVMCNPERTFESQRLNYNGVQNCKIFLSIYLSKSNCTYGCIGYGDCLKSCPQNAIILKNNTAVVTSSCCGCGQCLDICPVDLIKLLPYSKEMADQNITLCNVPEGVETTCSHCRKECKMEVRANPNLSIWGKLYKALKK